MPIPNNGHRQLVTLADVDGNFVPLVVDGSGARRLPVDVTGNIVVGEVQIGAVELSDGLSTTQRASIQPDATAVPAGPNDGGILIAGREGATQRHVRVNASGQLVVAGATGLTTTVLANAEETVEIAATDIFPADAVIPRDGLALLEFVTNTAAVFSLKVIRAATTRVADLRDGATIQANRWQAFEFPVRSGDALNLRVSVGGTVTAMISFKDV